MQLSIKTNFPEVQRELEALSKDVGNAATASALNKVTAQAKTAMSREIRQEFAISANLVNQRLRITRASANGGRLNIEASLQATKGKGKSINLINFGARQTAKGVSVKIKRAGARKVIKGAFIANKGRTVFIRVDKARLPIKALQTIDVPNMFQTKRINAKVLELIALRFPGIFANDVRFFTSKFNQTRS